MQKDIYIIQFENNNYIKKKYSLNDLYQLKSITKTKNIFAFYSFINHRFSRNNIAFDFDGVITESTDELKKQFFNKENIATPDCNINLKSIINHNKHPEIKNIREKYSLFVQYYLVENLNLVNLRNDIEDILNNLRKININCYIITSRKIYNNELISAIKWIISKKLNITGIIATSGKDKIHAINFLKPLCYIDDTLSKIQQIEKSGYYSNYLLSPITDINNNRTVNSLNEFYEKVISKCI